MHTETNEQKKLLRAQMKQQRRSLSLSFKEAASLQASAFAIQLLPKTPQLIGLFGSLPEEIDTLPLANAISSLGHFLCYPKATPKAPLSFYRALPSQLVLSDKKIPEPPHGTEPVPVHLIHTFFIPGLAFDLAGARLGFGGGYYDRTLSLANPTSLRIGYAFSCQLVESVPYASHDQLVHTIVTELGIRQINKGPFLYTAHISAKENKSHGSS